MALSTYIADAEDKEYRHYYISETLESRSGQEIDGLVQEIGNSIANALELRLSCTNPSKLRNYQIATFPVGSERTTALLQTFQVLVLIRNLVIKSLCRKISQDLPVLDHQQEQ